MDRLAQGIGMDPLELRLKNVPGEGDPLPTDVVLARVGFRETLQAVKEHPLQRQRPTGPYRGRGMACGMWIGGRQPNSACLKVNGDGSLGLLVGTVDLTGTRTAFTQMVSEEFGVSPDQVTVSVLDTQAAPFASTSAGSKTTYTMSFAIKQACDNVKAQLLRRAAQRLDLPAQDVVYQAGRIAAKSDPSRAVTLAELGQASVAASGGPIIGTGIVAGAKMNPSFAAHVADVEVDPETGKVTILGYWAFQDCGFAINPAQVEGQMQGGATQGIGWALNETYVFEDGVLRNPTFLDYRMPTALDLPFIEPIIIEVTSPEGPYGVRGVGEVSIVPPMAALANAIADATGVRLTELPMNPERVLFALQAKGDGPASRKR
jgi:CO/xanthine dehydrogenase Mo-binding subunit